MHLKESPSQALALQTLSSKKANSASNSANMPQQGNQVHQAVQVHPLFHIILITLPKEEPDKEPDKPY